MYQLWFQVPGIIVYSNTQPVLMLFITPVSCDKDLDTEFHSFFTALALRCHTGPSLSSMPYSILKLQVHDAGAAGAFLVASPSAVILFPHFTCYCYLATYGPSYMGNGKEVEGCYRYIGFTILII